MKAISEIIPGPSLALPKNGARALGSGFGTELGKIHFSLDLKLQPEPCEVSYLLRSSIQILILSKQIVTPLWVLKVAFSSTNKPTLLS